MGYFLILHVSLWLQIFYIRSRVLHGPRLYSKIHLAIKDLSSIWAIISQFYPVIPGRRAMEKRQHTEAA